MRALIGCAVVAASKTFAPTSAENAAGWADLGGGDLSVVLQVLAGARRPVELVRDCSSRKREWTRAASKPKKDRTEYEHTNSFN